MDLAGTKKPACAKTIAIPKDFINEDFPEELIPYNKIPCILLSKILMGLEFLIITLFLYSSLASPSSPKIISLGT